MSIKILMPALSPTMTEGNIAKWLKKEGDKILPGDVIVEIETDKATMEVEAIEEGILAKIISPQGSENIAINSVIAILLEDGEDAGTLENVLINIDKTVNKIVVANASISADLPRLMEVNQPSMGESKPITISPNQRVFASPLAKRLAVIENIDITNLQGTGPHGRIIKRDILSCLATPRAEQNTLRSEGVKRNSEEYRDVPSSNIRKIIAQRLVESKQTIPHFYLSIECNVDKLLEVREDINKSFQEDSKIKISVNDFIILAVAKALKIVPEANASWLGAKIRYYNNIDIAVAVAIDDGLITPIVKNADQKNIITLSSELQILIAKARNNKLIPEEFQGGGFSVSNLGMYGIKNFSAIINPPQSCILAVGASTKRPIVINEQIKIATIMEVTLSSDHRVVDGAVGAKFLSSFKKIIESPALMLI